MTPREAMRFLGHESRQCRDRDMREALCLLLPTLLEVLQLEPMDSFEALDFRFQLRESLREKSLTQKEAAPLRAA